MQVVTHLRIGRCINYNLKDGNMLGGGMYNGQFGVFDPRKGPGAVESTAMEHSHRYCTHHIVSGSRMQHTYHILCH